MLAVISVAVEGCKTAASFKPLQLDDFDVF
jgi:hypothetical protein